MDGGFAVPEVGGLRDLGIRLAAEGRADDALTVLNHVLSLQPDDREALHVLAGVQGDRGEVLASLEALIRLRDLLPDATPIMDTVRTRTSAAVLRYNALTAAGDYEAAEPFAAAMVRLVPHGPPMIAAAMACNTQLGRTEIAGRYARALLGFEPDNISALGAAADACRLEGDLDGETRWRRRLAVSTDPALHPLLQLRNLHDLISLELRRPRPTLDQADLVALLTVGHRSRLREDDDPEWHGWAKHYRLMLQAVEHARMGEARPASPEPGIAFLTSDGAATDWDGLRERAAAVAAEAVFFVAADAKYVELYARWYVLSVLKYCDRPCLIVVHVIGGEDDLTGAAKTVGVNDRRLVFAGDRFDASTVTTECFDAPPKGTIPIPVAHFQSVRFQRLGALLRELQRPVFVSDIDLLLQREVGDLLDRTAGADLVLNENLSSISACSRLTANLLLLYPNEDAIAFADWLKAFLGEALGYPAVSRWIDQIALSLGRQHLALVSPTARIDYFDTRSDINNVMYRSYQDHPFRFLSLYHGFDTSTLEDAALEA